MKHLSLLLLLTALSLLLSTALSSRPALSLFGGNWRRFGALVQCVMLAFVWMVALHSAGRPDRVRVILRGVAAAGALSAAYGIAQYFGWDPFLPAAAYHIGEGVWTIVRPPGTLGYVSYYATWLLSVLFLSLALAQMETRAAWQWAARAAAAIALVAMVLTGTRAALLGLAAGGAAWFIWKGFRPDRRLAVVAAAVLAGCAAFYFSPPGWELRSRTRWFVEDPWGGARPYLWRDSLNMAAHRPLMGYGPEVFTAQFPRFESKELARAYPDFSHESPHNIFLDVLVAQGIPGLAALAGISVAGFAAAWRLRAAWLAAALAGALVSQQFTAFTLPTALVFYLTVALAVALRSEAREAAPRHLRLAALAAPAAMALMYLAARFTFADCALERTRRSLEAGDVRSAATTFAHFERWRLPGAGADLWYARASMVLAQRTADPLARVEALAQSGAAAERATQTAEDPSNAWYNLAVIYAIRNDAAGAARALRAAIAASPNWFKPHWTLAQVLRLEGRMAEAVNEADQAKELDAGKNPVVARTYDEIRAQYVTGQQQE